jgi:hypothetical protein
MRPTLLLALAPLLAPWTLRGLGLWTTTPDLLLLLL